MSAGSQVARRGTAALLLALAAPIVAAIDFGDMMNPSRWFGGNRDRGDYYYREYGPYGPGYVPPYLPGYGYPAPYGIPGQWAPGYPGYGMSAPTVQRAAPEAKDAKDREIEELKRRIDQLEAAQRRPGPGVGPGGYQGYQGEPRPGMPMFRPLEQN